MRAPPTCSVPVGEGANRTRREPGRFVGAPSRTTAGSATADMRAPRAAVRASARGDTYAAARLATKLSIAMRRIIPLPRQIGFNGKPPTSKSSPLRPGTDRPIGPDDSHTPKNAARPMLNLIALVLLSLAARPSAAQGRAAASAQNRPLAALRIDARAQAVRTQVRARARVSRRAPLSLSRARVERGLVEARANQPPQVTKKGIMHQAGCHMGDLRLIDCSYPRHPTAFVARA